MCTDGKSNNLQRSNTKNVDYGEILQNLENEECLSVREIFEGLHSLPFPLSRSRSVDLNFGVFILCLSTGEINC